MGERGPAPKRSDQRRRRNKPEREVDEAPSQSAGVTPPPALDEWHPIARSWYESLANSGQSAFYQPSDWETARLIAESMSRELNPQVVGTDKESGEPIWQTVPIKGASLAAYLKAMTNLLVTEADRRRASVELQRPQDGGDDGEASDVSWIDDARARLRAAD